MSWVKLDDGFADHRKMLAVAERCGQSQKAAAACWLWACGLAYCNRQEARDGFIPSIKVPNLYPVKGAMDLAALLVDVNLWEKVDGGYQIHDYHDYQPHAREGLSDKRAAAGAAGGRASGEARRTKAAEARANQTRSNLLQANDEANEPPSRPLPSPAEKASPEHACVKPDAPPVTPAAVTLPPTPDHDAASAPALSLAPRFTAAMFADVWSDVTKRPAGPAGDGQAQIDAADLIRKTATLRLVEPAALGRHLVEAHVAMLAAWKAKKEHHGAAKLEGFVKHFDVTVDWLDEHAAQPALSGSRADSARRDQIIDPFAPDTSLVPRQ